MASIGKKNEHIEIASDLAGKFLPAPLCLTIYVSFCLQIPLTFRF